MTRRNIIWLLCDLAGLIQALFYTGFSAWASWYREQTYDTLTAYLFVIGYLALMYVFHAVSACIAFPALGKKSGGMLYLDIGLRLGVPVVVLAAGFIKYKTFGMIPRELVGLPMLATVQYAELLFRNIFNRKNES